jgi:hypothetical protein
MHFRIRKNVIQLIRVSYDAGKKKGVNTVVGSVRLSNPKLSEELRASLSTAEIEEFNSWLRTQHRVESLRDELAAMTLAENLSRAARWFQKEGGSESAHSTAAEIVAQWQSLRRLLVRNGLLE